MDRQGLYWPNGRNLFRRRLPAGVRVALWLVVIATAVLVAWVSVHAH